MKRSYLRISCIAFLLLFLFQWLSSFLGSVIAKLIDYSFWDPDNTFMYITVHHIVQMFFAIIAIFILYKVYKWKFNCKFAFSKVGIYYTIVFLL